MLMPGGWRWALASGPSPGPFSEQERARLIAGGGGSRQRKRDTDKRRAPEALLPAWVTTFVIVMVVGVWSATYLAAIVRPDFSPDGWVGPALLAVIPMVSAYHIVVSRKNGGDDE